MAHTTASSPARPPRPDQTRPDQTQPLKARPGQSPNSGIALGLGGSRSPALARGAGDTGRTFVNETHILLVGRGEDLTAAWGRAGATVPLAVVDNSGDGGAGGAQAHKARPGATWDPSPTPQGRPPCCLTPTWSLRGCLVLALHSRVPSASEKEAQTLGVEQSHPLHGSFKGGKGAGGPPSPSSCRRTAVGSPPTRKPRSGEDQPQSGQSQQVGGCGPATWPRTRRALLPDSPQLLGHPCPGSPSPRLVAGDGSNGRAQTPFRSHRAPLVKSGLRGASATPVNPNSALPAHSAWSAVFTEPGSHL